MRPGVEHQPRPAAEQAIADRVREDVAIASREYIRRCGRLHPVSSRHTIDAEGALFGEAGQQQAYLAIEGIDFADGFYTRMVLGYAATIAQAGLALVAGAGINFR